jgi:hypothetical protein
MVYMYVAAWPGPHSKINHSAIQLARQDERGGGRGWDGMHVRPSLSQPRRQTIWECVYLWGPWVRNSVQSYPSGPSQPQPFLKSSYPFYL